MSFETLKNTWEQFAESDALWAIYQRKNTKRGRWKLDDFFATGKIDADKALNRAASLGLDRYERILDFGCGAGRVTRWFASSFNEVYGTDISEKMIELARRLNADYSNCHFTVNGETLAFPNEFFDMIHSLLTFQHLPTEEMMQRYLTEFVRTLRIGGLAIVQIPHTILLWRRIEARRWAYEILHSLRFDPRFLYGKLGFHPTTMKSMREEKVCKFLSKTGVKIMDVEVDRQRRTENENRIYYFTKASRDHPGAESVKLVEPTVPWKRSQRIV